MRRRSLSILTGLAVLTLLTASCGYKAPPRPLLQPLPTAPGNLSVRQFGTEVQLAWTLPQTNQDGSELTDLAGFDIYRMSYDPAADCPECRDTSVLIERLDLAYLQNARREGNRVFYLDRGITPGTGYRYRIVPFTGNQQAGAPAQKEQVMIEPPPPPDDLLAEGHDRLVRLSWAVAIPADPQQVLLGYNIYRRRGDAHFSRLPLNQALLTITEFDDFEVTNGARYGYQVTSVVRSVSGTAESAPSAQAEATPEAGR